MKLRSFQRLALATAFVIAGISNSTAQDKPASPKKTATGKIGAANVTITYSSPSVKGRKIWGELVPYGKVWRAGANEATIIETDKELVIDGKKLAAGKYSVYILPTEKEWQIIINSKTGQWGIERSGETTRKLADDVVVVTVKPKPAAMEESLEYTINNNGIGIKWEKLEAAVPIK